MSGEAPRRGEIWLASLDKVRPVVVMHRDFAGRRLGAVLAAPLTSTIRDIPTAVRLGPDDGLDRDCIASLDNLTLVPRAAFHERVGRLPPRRMDDLCAALLAAVDCASSS